MTVARVEQLLRDLTGGVVQVAAVETLATGRGVVERMRLVRPLPEGDTSVIAKQRALGEWSRTSQRSEAAALSALAGKGRAARLIVDDIEGGMLLQSDVGEDSVEKTLIHGTAATATIELAALGQTLGQLHRTPVTPDRLSGQSTWTIGTHALDWPLLVRVSEQTALPSPGPSVAREARELLATLVDAGAQHVLVHGDLTPSNAVVGPDGRCRLVDFEGSTLQHFGVDAAMLRFPFAWYGRWALLPEPVQQQMEQAYRDECGRSDVDHGIAVGCAAMALLRLQRLPTIADPEQPPRDAARRRVQIVSTLEVAAAAMSDAACFPALRVWLAAVTQAMRERWEDANLPAPMFPAFKDT